MRVFWIAGGRGTIGRMEAFRHDLRPLLELALRDEAVDALAWRDYGPGLQLAKLAREDACGLVLYRVAAHAPRDAFARHRHPGGELYLVLKGVIGDETGRYEAGSLVWLPPGSTHTPWAEGDTLVLVLWPEGVEIE